jgi:hypothetical protein
VKKQHRFVLAALALVSVVGYLMVTGMKDSEGPTAAPEIVQTLLVSLLAFTLLFFALLLFRYGLEVLRQREEALRVRAETGRPLFTPQGVPR